MAELTRSAIDAERLTRDARRPECGAVVVFHGTTRNHHQGRRVTVLHYEAYEPMALAALEAIERARYDVLAGAPRATRPARLRAFARTVARSRSRGRAR